ncbi:MAG: hypothetical protein RLZZ282_284 [Verrucomicrobiota bacterium]|jgi:hypothetical protein
MRHLLFLWILTGIVQAAEMRSWTDLQNRTIEARMLSLNGQSVMLSPPSS